MYNNIKNIFMAMAIIVGLASCKKDYYYDTGVHNGKYSGSILQYLEGDKTMFDTTVMVIKLAGMEDVIDKENITFFAPTSSSIYKSVKALNIYLKDNGKDTVSQLQQIKTSVWRKNLARYVFKGANMLKDYPQLDTLAFTAYPGQAYTSYNGEIMNVGVIYNDAGGVKYAGYRQLYLSFIRDRTKPTQSLVNAPVATSDIQANNGILHVLRAASRSSTGQLTSKHNFGFLSDFFINDALSAGIDPAD